MFLQGKWANYIMQSFPLIMFVMSSNNNQETGQESGQE